MVKLTAEQINKLVAPIVSEAIAALYAPGEETVALSRAQAQSILNNVAAQAGMLLQAHEDGGLCPHCSHGTMRPTFNEVLPGLALVYQCDNCGALESYHAEGRRNNPRV